MNVPQLSPSSRREDFRAWWAEHLNAYRDSGQNLANYGRAWGPDPKYFALWKRKLRKERSPAKTIESPRLVPVTVRPDRSTLAPNHPQSEAAFAPAAVVAIRLNRGYGISARLAAANCGIDNEVVLPVHGSGLARRWSTLIASGFAGLRGGPYRKGFERWEEGLPRCRQRRR